MEENEDEPEDVRLATPVEDEIKKGQEDEPAKDQSKVAKKQVKNGTKKKKKTEDEDCCANKSRWKKENEHKKITIHVFEKECKPPKPNTVPRHCLSKKEHLDMLATPKQKCPPQCLKKPVMRKSAPVSPRLLELARPARQRLLRTLEDRGDTLAPELLDNLIKIVEAEACLTPEQAAQLFRDKKSRSKEKRKKKKRGKMKCSKKETEKRKENGDYPSFDPEAVCCQYFMAEKFVRSILDWKCPIPKNEYQDIAEIILRRLSFILEYTPTDNGDRKTQQMRFLADMISSWISGVLIEVAEAHKKELEEECERRRQAEEEDTDESEEKMSTSTVKSEVEDSDEDEGEPEEEGKSEEKDDKSVKKDDEDEKGEEPEGEETATQTQPEQDEKETEIDEGELEKESEEPQGPEEGEIDVQKPEEEEGEQEKIEEDEKQITEEVEKEEDQAAEQLAEVREAEQEIEKEAEGVAEQEFEKEAEGEVEKEVEEGAEIVEEGAKKVVEEEEEEEKEAEEVEKEADKEVEKEAPEESGKEEPEKLIEIDEPITIGKGPTIKVFQSDLPFVTFIKVFNTLYTMMESEEENFGQDPIINRLHRAVYEKFHNAVNSENPALLTNNAKDVINVMAGKIAIWLSKILSESQVLLLDKYPPKVESVEVRDWSKWLNYTTQTAGNWTIWLQTLIKDAQKMQDDKITRGQWHEWTQKLDTNASLWRKFHLDTVHQAHHNAMMIRDREIVKTGEKKIPDFETELKLYDLE